MMMSLWRLPVGLLFALLLHGEPLAAQSNPQRSVLYDEKADGSKLIEESLAIAKKENKKVMLQFGANWCSWCHRLHHLFQTDVAIHEKLVSDYVVVHLDVNDGHNQDLNLRYGQPTRLGLPAIVVLDSEGQPLMTQDTAELEEDDHYDRNKVLAFLNGDWKATTEQAAPARDLDVNGMDTSSLPESIQMEKTRSDSEGDLLIESFVFKSGDVALLERTLVSSRESKKVVRIVHQLLLPEKQVIALYDFKKSASHAESHSMFVSGLPKETQLMNSEADLVSKQEWRLTKKDEIYLSYVRDADGLIRPRTRGEFIKDLTERFTKLSQE
ncbi:MAG: thioredoxin family protein [Prosthecobacter sp.]|nr:thioredoxin family protein [Prosthecobacter sp.]